VQPVPSPIPVPEALNPDRVLSGDRDEMTLEEYRDRAERLDAALHQSCSYARRLWDQLHTCRAYLLESLPPDPHALPTAARRGAAPEGPLDESGWAAWTQAYAGVTSILAGPDGDAGNGLSEARLTAQQRRA
jgi:hypothetical protein